MPAALLDLADDDFVLFTTFRKSGEAVSTPVWIARDGDDLLVTTPTETGKVKRIRNNSRVELRPSTRMGKVKEGTAAIEGIATIEPDDEGLRKLFADKYKFQYRLFMWIESRGKVGAKPRVLLRISAK